MIRDKVIWATLVAIGINGRAAFSQEYMPVDRLVADCSATPQRECAVDEYFAEYDYTAGRTEGHLPRGPSPFDWDIGTNHVSPLGRTEVDELYDLLGHLHEYVWEKFARNGGNGYGGIGTDADSLTFTDGSVYVEISDATFDIDTNGDIARLTSDGILVTNTGWTVPDVVGHEYGHSVANSQSWNGRSFTGMITEGEGGALEESWGDILGEALERNLTGENDWAWGTGGTLDNGPYIQRAMDDPRLYLSTINNQPLPDRYLHPNFYIGSEDSGGVHVNSGIPSKAFYLLSDGGYFNGYQIEAIGFDKAEQIWYRCVSDLFGTSPTFNDAYHDLLAAADELYGEFEVEQVGKALRAVQMHLSRTDPGGDFNDDGVVDGGDFLQWQRTAGLTIDDPLETTDLRADRSRDGVIDGADLAIWQATYGAGEEAPAAYVPEPGGAILVLAAAIFLNRRSHNERRRIDAAFSSFASRSYDRSGFV
jgi:hypothetical protein